MRALINPFLLMWRIPTGPECEGPRIVSRPAGGDGAAAAVLAPRERARVRGVGDGAADARGAGRLAPGLLTQADPGGRAAPLPGRLRRIRARSSLDLYGMKMEATYRHFPPG